MALVSGNKKNKEIVSEVEPQIHDGVEFANEEPQTSKDAEIKALRKEMVALTEALGNQQWVNREQADFENPFGNNFVNMDHQQQRKEIHLVRAPNPGLWCARESPDHRITMPKPHQPLDPQESHFVSHGERDFKGEKDFEPHCGLINGPSRASHMGPLKPPPLFDPFRIRPNPGPDPNKDKNRSGFNRLQTCNTVTSFVPNHNHQQHPTHNHEILGYVREPPQIHTFDRELRRPPGFDQGFDCVPRRVLGLDRGFDREPHRV